jgi:peptidoglycan-binding domain 1 protein
MNNLIDAVRNYKAQKVKGGLGAGGAMKVAD